MEDLQLIILVVAAISCFYFIRMRNVRMRRWWVRPVLKNRPQQGGLDHLFRELKDDASLFFRYTRMTLETFNQLLAMISPHIIKQNWRAFPPELRLIVTLRYLATGDQPLSIALAYRIGESTVLAIIKETCQVLHDVLMPIYLQCPEEHTWRNIMEGFLETWNMPLCLGAIDGKHILIQAPPNSGSLYFNYKKTFSIVLMAACDHKYKFTLVDIGAYGSNNDAGIFAASEFGQGIFNETLNIPMGKAALPGSELKMSCFFVGDDAFALNKHIMKPYPGKNLSREQKIFNYRLSRARRTIENTFGILVSRWRIFRKRICLKPESVDHIVMAAVCLHNFLMCENECRTTNQQIYCPPNFVDKENFSGVIELGEWRQQGCDQGTLDLPATKHHKSTKEASGQRKMLTDYFLTEKGLVPWKDSYVEQGFNRPN